jgi:4-amino-4-deoxy-L-arabinose transferase-like glycosyltransferase
MSTAIPCGASQNSDAGTRRVLVLTLLAAAVLRLVIAGAAPVFDPTEGRYAEIARNMADTGDWVTPRLWVDGDQVPFLGKPPLFFWTAALSIRLFGRNEFAVRLPSFLASAALLFLMFVVLSRYLGRSVAESAVLMTATSGIFFFLSGSVAVDMHLALCVAGALLAYLAFALEPDERIQKRWSLLVFLLLAGGFMTKGPVALVLFGLPVLLWTAFRKKWRLLAHHAWWTGIPLFALLVVPWFVLAEVRNPGFLHYFFVNENLLRFLRPEYGDLYGTGHPFPRGSAILMFVVAAIPWSGIAIWRAATSRRALFKELMNDDVQVLLVLGFAAPVLFWCFARQLLLTYMAPMIPSLCTWVAVTRGSDEGAVRSGNRIALGAVAVWIVALVAAVPMASGDSTRNILQEARRVVQELDVSDEVTFANRTPQSAFFYAPDIVHDHSREGIGETVQQALDTYQRRLLIVRGVDLGRVPPDLLDRLLLVGRSPGWLLYVTRLRKADPPSPDRRRADAARLGVEPARPRPHQWSLPAIRLTSGPMRSLRMTGANSPSSRSGISGACGSAGAGRAILAR